MSPSRSNPELSAGGVIFNRAGEIVVVEQLGPSFSLPKGHVDEGETELQAALREIREETGITDLVLVADLGTYSRPNVIKPGELKDMHMYVFFTAARSVSPLDPDNAGGGFFAPARAISMLPSPADKRQIYKALPHIQRHLRQLEASARML